MEKNSILKRAFESVAKTYRLENRTPGTLRSIGIKPQWNVVIGTQGQCGLALNFTGEHAVYAQKENPGQIASFQMWIGRNLLDFAAHLLDQEDIQSRSICLATLNALSQPLTDFDRLKNKGFTFTGEEMPEFVRPEDVVMIIGYGGIVRFFAGKCKELHISDMRPKESFQTMIIGKQIGFGPKNITLHTADENKSIISRSDVVIITACTLVNDTFDELVQYAQKARVVGLYGPSAQLMPDFFLENGINFIRCFRVKDAQRFEYDMVNDQDMEVALKTYQQTYHVFNF